MNNYELKLLYSELIKKCGQGVGRGLRRDVYEQPVNWRITNTFHREKKSENLLEKSFSLSK